MHNYEEVSNDALSIRGFQEYRCNDYHLEFVAEDVLYYIVSPKDVVLAKMRDGTAFLFDLMYFGCIISSFLENDEGLGIQIGTNKKMVPFGL